MGWASGGEIFDPVCEALLKMHCQGEAAKKVLVTLIKRLQVNDWDTEYESLGEFRGYPVVVDAFRECGIEELPFENTPGAG